MIDVYTSFMLRKRSALYFTDQTIERGAQVAPPVSPQALDDSALYLLPERQDFLVQASPLRCQRDRSRAAIRSGPDCDEAAALKWTEVARQRALIHRHVLGDVCEARRRIEREICEQAELGRL